MKEILKFGMIWGAFIALFTGIIFYIKPESLDNTALGWITGISLFVTILFYLGEEVEKHNLLKRK